MTDLLLAFHFICGGDSVSACLLSVELEQRSPTSISRNIIWSLPDSDKAVGASALSNTSWSHQTIKIPRTETESQVIIRTEYNYLDGGGIGLDNIVLSSSRQCSHTWRRVPGYELETEFDQFWRLVPRYSHSPSHWSSPSLCRKEEFGFTDVTDEDLRSRYQHIQVTVETIEQCARYTVSIGSPPN